MQQHPKVQKKDVCGGVRYHRNAPFDPKMYPYGSYIFTITIEDLAGNTLSRDFTIHLEQQASKLPDLYWEILITVIGSLIAGVITTIFFIIRKKFFGKSD